MEEDKKQNIEEDFGDFGEESDFVAPNIDELDKQTQDSEEDIPTPEFKEENESLEKDEVSSNEETNEAVESIEETSIDTQEETTPSEEIDTWEEKDSKNNVVKKYITYINKANVKFIDSMEVDERNEFINQAIQLKIENDKKEKENSVKKQLALHFVVMIATAIVFLPVAVWIAHQCIVLTFNNYKYSQESIEKLYRESFKNDKIYIRSQNYNKQREEKQKQQKQSN